ncbi:MAG: phosphoserine phosphatase SerB [Actinomycetota bacterium]
MRYRLVLFDVDSTLIEQEVIDLLAVKTPHLATVADITKRAMAGELDFDSALKERVALLRGLPETVLDDVRQEITFSQGALTLISSLQQMGVKIGAVSGGFLNVLTPLFHDLKLDYLKANTLDIKDSVLSGNVVGPIINSREKLRALKEFSERSSIPLSQTIAVGDGANDVLMIESAGLGVSYRGKAILNEAADVVLAEAGLDTLLNYF